MGREWELSYRLGNACPARSGTIFLSSGELSRKEQGKGFILPFSKKFFEIIDRRKNNNQNVYLNFIEKMIKKNKFYKECTITIGNTGKSVWVDSRTNCPIYLEKHRIDPGHEGGTYNPSNTILLTFPEHIMAHFLRYLQYGNPSDRAAFSLMLSQDNSDARRAIASIAGKIGGSAVQKMLKAQNCGWYNSEVQRELGKRGAAAARAAGTGFFDPKTNEMGVAAWLKKYNSDKHFANKMNNNLRQGNITQKQLGINVYDSVSQRIKSVRYRGILINGVRWSAEIDMVISGKMIYSESRTHVSETFFWYYIAYAEPTRPRHTNN
jgi:hypothetical protein